MAYRGGAGIWIAIVFLTIMTIVFAALYLRRETRIQEVLEAISKDPATALADKGKWNNSSVRNLLQEKEDLAKQIEGLRKIIRDKEEAIRDRDAAIEEKQQQNEELATQTKTLEAEIVHLKASNTQLQQKFKEIRNERNEELNAEIANLRDLYNKQQVRSENLLHKLKRMEELQEALRSAYQRRVIELQRENHALRQVIDKFEKESRGRVEIMKEEYDGKVIQVDIENKFVVVDLGRAHKVHRGMRFDVIRWRLNNWDRMGVIQITKVGTTTSQGVILDAIVQQKVCPITGWIAPNPEMKYSPYAAGGAENNMAVPLVKTEVVEKASMRKLDPIVIGDYISNPFYSKKRMLKFVVAGQPVRYSLNEIRQQITNYGGQIQDAVDVDTDYLVLGQIPEEGSVAELEKAESKLMREQAMKARDTAKQYGIPIMREVELFEFLRH